MVKVGETVRVRLSDESSAKATVLVDNENGTFQLSVGSGSGEREVTAAASAVSPLLDFEHHHSDAMPATELKEHGNTLFGLKDYASAWGFYTKAVAALSLQPISVGSSVIVASSVDQYHFCSGTVCDVSSSDAYSIMLDSSDKEEQCSAERLLPMGQPSSPARELCRALYMNLGRCCVKLGKKGWAVRWFTLAVTVALGSSDNEAEQHKHLVDAYAARFRAYVMFGKLLHAKKDAHALEHLDVAKGAALVREAEQRLARRHQQDRRLAKDVAAWVGEAMETKPSSAESFEKHEEYDYDDAGGEDAADGPDDEDGAFMSILRQLSKSMQTTKI